MSEIPLEVQMHAERLYDEGGCEAVPTIIAKAIMAERERAAKIAEEFPPVITETMELPPSQYDIATAIRTPSPEHTP